jgi:Predicted Zn-dependent peptidases
MYSLAFSEKSLEVQRKVVCEEFKEHYINKPYGDTWQHLRSLCYTQHPYQWMTIGKELSHIENATLEDVKSFFYKHYRPCNAVLAVAGPVEVNQIKALAEKWFGDIPSGEKYIRNIPPETSQVDARAKYVEKNVPVSVIYKAYPIEHRLHSGYYHADVITEILGGGQSSRLFQRLVKERQLFSQIDCYHTGSVENGLLVVEGKLLPHITPEIANEAIEKEIEALFEKEIEVNELEKVMNKIESLLAFEDLSLLNRANNLAFYELLGDADSMNHELEKYRQVTTLSLKEYALKTLTHSKSNTLYYLAKK